MERYLKRIFALMFGAVGLTALASYVMLTTSLWTYLINPYTGNFSVLYYVILFGALGISIWGQVRAFSMKPTSAALILGLYSVMMGIGLTPLIAGALAVNPMSLVYAFGLSAAMFACMALFGYKTVKNLSFLGSFLMMGMLGLILVGVASFIWPLGDTFATIVCFGGILVFALFTAYDMQNLKNAYAMLHDNDAVGNRLAVLGALHLYISFIAMFQYVLGLLNRD